MPLLFLFLRLSSSILASNCLWVFSSASRCLRRSAVFRLCLAVLSTLECDGEASSPSSWLSSSSSLVSTASLCFFLARLFASREADRAAMAMAPRGPPFPIFQIPMLTCTRCRSGLCKRVLVCVRATCPKISPDLEYKIGPALFKRSVRRDKLDST